jgi:hypothetical protein
MLSVAMLYIFLQAFSIPGSIGCVCLSAVSVQWIFTPFSDYHLFPARCLVFRWGSPLSLVRWAERIGTVSNQQSGCLSLLVVIAMTVCATIGPTISFLLSHLIGRAVSCH